MTRKQKNAWMLYILSNDKQCHFNFNMDFFLMDWFELHKLDQYAEIFNIKPRNGKSRARTLWDRVTEEMPF